MCYDDFPFQDFDGSERSFVPSEHVLRYVEEFSKPIKDLIWV